jgi:hypothetical protein
VQLAGKGFQPSDPCSLSTAFSLTRPHHRLYVMLLLLVAIIEEEFKYVKSNLIQAICVVALFSGMAAPESGKKHLPHGGKVAPPS